ncbi:PhzF family phenazine biosynthesis protein [Litchfieldella rifensis]|uniref:PhzF family phenazine biosynthesis protein n=1 Tax=Litchfieldella rifensis TaxID=762643 RepID=A0ABV7LL14_9GAMM
MPPDNHRYLLLDVFSGRPFAGNPLAVFPEAEGMAESRMQAIANELNLSETVFVGTPTAKNRFPIRIFTPSTELPFAGHPTVGTAHLLVALGMAERGQPLTLQARVGDLEVRFEDDLAYFTTAQPVEIGVSSLDRTTAAALLGLAPSQVIATPVVASCGLPFHLIELDSRETLAQAQPSSPRWLQHVSPSHVEQIYLYVNDGEALNARMFSTELGGLHEDPATGSAASALAGFLATHREGPGHWQWQIEQGIEMGRASLILAEVRRDDAGAMTIRIGGQAVLIGEGHVYSLS